MTDQNGTRHQYTRYDDSRVPCNGGPPTSIPPINLTTVTDPATGITSTYDRQGEVVQTVNAAGTTHQFTYDTEGRQIADSVTAVGTGINTAVLRIEDHYDVRGLLTSVLSYDAASGGNVVNDVEMTYNDFGQLNSEEEEHQGAVTANSLQVGYECAGPADGLRQTALVYPGGRTVTYAYGDSTDAAGELNRIGSILDYDGNTLATYSYLGLGTIVTEGTGSGRERGQAGTLYFRDCQANKGGH